MTKEEIVQAISDDKMMPFIQSEQLAGIVDFVIKNYKPSIPSNLDEAAEEYAADLHFSISAAFIAGAEWMSLQRTRTRLAVKSNTPEGKEAYEKVAKEMRASVAAKDYGEGIYCPILKHKNKTGLNCTAVEDAFLKGAEWMAGQGWIDDGSMPPETKQESDTLQGHREWTESEPVLAWDSMYGCCVDWTRNGKWMSEQTSGYAGQVCHGIIAWRPIPEYKEKQ